MNLYILISYTKLKLQESMECNHNNTLIQFHNRSRRTEIMNTCDWILQWNNIVFTCVKFCKLKTNVHRIFILKCILSCIKNMTTIIPNYQNNTAFFNHRQKPIGSTIDVRQNKTYQIYIFPKGSMFCVPIKCPFPQTFIY